MKTQRLNFTATVYLLFVFFLSAESQVTIQYQGMAAAPAAKYALWYRTPAGTILQDGFPIGNSYIGGFVSGGVDRDRIVLNEKSLWYGSASRGYGARAGASAFLSALRAAIIAGDYKTDSTIFQNNWCGDFGDFGSYTTLGNIYLDFAFPSSITINNYRRELDLMQGIGRTSFTYNGADYMREYFCSYPDKIMVIRLTCSQPSKLNFTASLATPQNSPAISAAAGTVTLHGKISNFMEYEAQMKLINDGGSLTTNASTVTVTNANSVTIIMSAATNYILTFPTYTGGNPHTIVSTRLAGASSTYATLKNTHMADYQALFNRVSLDLAPTPTRPTDTVLINYKSAENPALDALYFHYARYIMISCSRPGTLPANLNGMWTDVIFPEWGGQYTCDINVQDTYWITELANLTECSVPLVNWVNALRPSGRITAESHYGVTGGGWVTHSQGNIWGFTGIKPWIWCGPQPSDAAWLCQNLWEIYDFTRNKEYLQSTIYPIIKEAAQFWTKSLMVDPSDSTLVSCPGISAEHGRRGQFIDCLVMGSTMDQTLIWQLFTNVIKAGEILGVDSVYRIELIDKRNRLSMPQIDPVNHQIREWKNFSDSLKYAGHRHMSHLLGLYPLNMFTSTQFPALYEAARVSTTWKLKAGGELGQYGFTEGQLSNMFARLNDAENAYSRFAYNLKSISLPNLIGTTSYNKSVFLVENNCALSAALVEMLVQSHQDSMINLLPALPNLWSNGSVKGLCARGGFEVAMTWQNKALTAATITSKKGTVCRLKNPLFGGSFTISDNSGNPVSYTRSGTVITFTTTENGVYHIPGVASAAFLASFPGTRALKITKVGADRIHLDLPRAGAFSVALYSLSGRKLYELASRAQERSLTIPLPAGKFGKGLYLLCARQGKSKTWMKWNVAQAKNKVF